MTEKTTSKNELSKAVDSVHGQKGLTVQVSTPLLGGGHGQSPPVADLKIDVAALAVRVPPRPKCDKPQRPRRRPSLAQIEAGRAAARRGRAVVSERRGFTFEHEVATLIEPGREYTTRDVWKLTRGRTKKQVSKALVQLWQRGVLARRPIPGAPEAVQTIHRATGRVMTWKPSKWLYSLTERGKAYAEEGRLRRMLE